MIRYTLLNGSRGNNPGLGVCVDSSDVWSHKSKLREIGPLSLNSDMFHTFWCQIKNEERVVLPTESTSMNSITDEHFILVDIGQHWLSSL